MLKELSVNNLAVIDELSVGFDKGFHIITGETGAGKSVLMEAIALVLGGKAQAGLTRDGTVEAVIEAVFDLSSSAAARLLLRDDGLANPDDENELIVRRHIQPDGKGRVFINHHRAALNSLKKIAALLVDYTGQHQQIELLDSRNDIAVLDQFLTDGSVLGSYASAYSAVQAIRRNVEEWEKIAATSVEKTAWLKACLKEYDGLRLASAEEESALKERRERLRHTATVAKLTQMADETLSGGEFACVAQIARLMREVEKETALAGVYECAIKSLADANAHLEDVAYQFAKIGGRAEIFETEWSADEIEAELYRVEKLKRRFGPGWDEILARRDSLTAELKKLTDSHEELTRARARMAVAVTQLKEPAIALRKARVTAGRLVEKEIASELEDLNMGDASFSVRVLQRGSGTDIADYGPLGLDEVTFMLSSNPGLGARPLAEIASGGEASRLFLAVKNVLTRFKPSGTLIFDEIDAGLSGAVAEKAGHKLKCLARRFQVLCITHHAQIASLADRHFLVVKAVERGKTLTRVKILSNEERVREVARLVGGVQITATNRRFAREMVEKGGEPLSPHISLRKRH